MVNFEIHGTPDNVSKEELRCMLQAMATIQEYHNKKPKFIKDNKIRVIVTNNKKMLGKTKYGGQAAGSCCSNKILIGGWFDFNQTFTIACHEVIHYFNPDFPKELVEWLTSTLNNRLKPSVANIYNGLIEGVYERAGYFAHTKIAYKQKNNDAYNHTEWNVVECSEAGKKYRKIVNKEEEI
jgi:hypothetical protein